MMATQRRQYTQQELAERALIVSMADYPLKPGQMLLLGPRSVAMLTKGGFAGKLPDKFVLEREEWCAGDVTVTKSTAGRRSGRGKR